MELSLGLKPRYRDNTRSSWKAMGDLDHESLEDAPAVVEEEVLEEMPVIYRVYKQRWFGLAMLMLLNIVTSWGVSWFSYFSPGGCVE
jgi:hypothetical protein